MDRTARYLFISVGALIVFLFPGLASAHTATLRCVASQKQVAVYDSLNTLGVEAKLQCGEDVEIIGRVKNYVKIRAQNGVEGYVPDTLVAGLSSSEVHRDSAPHAALIAQQAPKKETPQEAANNPSVAPAVSPVAVTGSADPAQSTSEKKQSSSGSAAPSPAYAEMNPATAPLPPGETATNSDVKSPASQPADSHSSSSTAHPAAVATPATSVNPAAHAAAPSSDSDDVPGSQPENESADPACQNYFSAYGLTPSQMKWIAQNRKKRFSQVCPAPDPSKVDFVIIFTHDVNFFSATMPKTVHEVAGFSDFTAITPIEAELMSAPEADKAHHQYVWVFRFAPGTFDPARFSPRRRYQYSKVESNSLGSKAALKVVDDAFQFVATANH
jgi:hypothetical protein